MLKSEICWISKKSCFNGLEVFDKKSSGVTNSSGAVTRAHSETLDRQDKSAIENKSISKQQSAEALRKPIIKKIEKRKVYSSFIDNIWGADLADMQLISKFNKGIRFLLCVIDFLSKYTCCSFGRLKRYCNY